MFYLAYLALGLAVFYMVKTIFSDEERRSAHRALSNTQEKADGGNVFLRYTRPFFSRYLVPFVADMKIDNKRKILKRKLAGAGLTDVLTPDELYSFKLFLILTFPLLLFVVGSKGWEMDITWYWYPASMVVGYLYPDHMWLKGVMQKRQESILRAMPFVVDLLALSTEAGLDFMGAIAKVVEKAKHSPLIEEFDILLKEIKVGSSRAEAMRNLAWRINMIEINSFIAVLISADEMGASIGKILREQSEQIRHERFVRAEKAGAKAASKILIPMIFFIVPAIFIMIFGPFFLGFMSEGSGDLF